MFGDEEADLADAELVDRHRLRREDADLFDLVVLPFAISRIFMPGRSDAVDHADDDDDAAVGVVPGIEDQRLERRVGIARAAAAAAATIASRMSRVPMPSLALARMAPVASRPMMSSIWRLPRPAARPADRSC